MRDGITGNPVCVKESMGKWQVIKYIICIALELVVALAGLSVVFMPLGPGNAWEGPAEMLSLAAMGALMVSVIQIVSRPEA